MRLFFLFLIVAIPLYAAESGPGDWKLRRDREGIQVYTRKVADSPFDAVRSTMVLEGIPLSTMVALINDAEACPQWADRCAESRIHERTSETEVLVYTHNNLPFPVKDRDVLSHVKWRQDPGTLTVIMTSSAATGLLEETSGRVRLTHANVDWIFEPLDDGSVRVTNEAHVDPAGPLPAWLVNMLLVDTPWESFRGFREAIKNPKYAGAHFGFITEPGT